MMWKLWIILSLYGAVLANCPVYEYGVTESQKNEIVNVHNYYRLAVANARVPNQPQGANLMRMKWDESLAIAAQNIAYSCQFQHQSVNDGRFRVGQNLFTFYSTNYISGANWTQAITAWFNEYTTYTFSNSVYNHYTQVVWASTFLVGCGYTYYLNSNQWYQKLYVCNYGPAGNFIGQYPYVVGQGCVNLCSSNRK